jgi:hypothetical protein
MVWVSSVYLEGPCQVGNTFTVTVNLWNQQSWTGDAIMGFDFSLYWYSSTTGFTCAGSPIASPGTPFITLESAVFTSPWANYFVVYNGTATTSVPGWTGYELAITGEAPSAPLTNVNITLVTLTFQINAEPSFPDVWQTPLWIQNYVKLSNPDGSPITNFEADNGVFNLQPGTPDAELASTLTLPTDKSTGLPYIIESDIGNYYTFEVWMTNMSAAYGFDFELCYPSQYLSIDQPNGITISPLFPQPYDELYEYTSTPGQVQVVVLRSIDKPLVCGAAINVANVTFTSIDDNVVADMLIPENSTGTNPIQLISASQDSLVCGVEVYYGLSVGGVSVYYNGVYFGSYAPSYSLTTGTTIGPGLYNWQIEYFWRPIGTTNEYGYWVGTDLNLDSVVNIQDLEALAAEYGVDLGVNGWGELASIGSASPTTIVDIYDFVLVAKMFGTGTKSNPWVPSI